MGVGGGRGRGGDRPRRRGALSRETLARRAPDRLRGPARRARMSTASGRVTRTMRDYREEVLDRMVREAAVDFFRRKGEDA